MGINEIRKAYNNFYLIRLIILTIILSIYIFIINRVCLSKTSVEVFRAINLFTAAPQLFLTWNLVGKDFNINGKYTYNNVFGVLVKILGYAIGTAPIFGIAYMIGFNEDTLVQEFSLLTICKYAGIVSAILIIGATIWNLKTPYSSEKYITRQDLVHLKNNMNSAGLSTDEAAILPEITSKMTRKDHVLLKNDLESVGFKLNKRY